MYGWLSICSQRVVRKELATSKGKPERTSLLQRAFGRRRSSLAANSIAQAAVEDGDHSTHKSGELQHEHSLGKPSAWITSWFKSQGSVDGSIKHRNSGTLSERNSTPLTGVSADGRPPGLTRPSLQRVVDAGRGTVRKLGGWLGGAVSPRGKSVSGRTHGGRSDSGHAGQMGARGSVHSRTNLLPPLLEPGEAEALKADEIKFSVGAKQRRLLSQASMGSLLSLAGAAVASQRGAAHGMVGGVEASAGSISPASVATALMAPSITAASNRLLAAALHSDAASMTSRGTGSHARRSQTSTGAYTPMTITPSASLRERLVSPNCSMQRAAAAAAAVGVSFTPFGVSPCSSMQRNSTAPQMPFGGPAPDGSDLESAPAEEGCGPGLAANSGQWDPQRYFVPRPPMSRCWSRGSSTEGTIHISIQDAHAAQALQPADNTLPLTSGNRVGSMGRSVVALETLHEERSVLSAHDQQLLSALLLTGNTRCRTSRLAACAGATDVLPAEAGSRATVANCDESQQEEGVDSQQPQEGLVHRQPQEMDQNQQGLIEQAHEGDSLVAGAELEPLSPHAPLPLRKAHSLSATDETTLDNLRFLLQVAAEMAGTTQRAYGGQEVHEGGRVAEPAAAPPPLDVLLLAAATGNAMQQRGLLPPDLVPAEGLDGAGGHHVGSCSAPALVVLADALMSQQGTPGSGGYGLGLSHAGARNMSKSAAQSPIAGSSPRHAAASVRAKTLAAEPAHLAALKLSCKSSLLTPRPSASHSQRSVPLGSTSPSFSDGPDFWVLPPSMPAPDGAAGLRDAEGPDSQRSRSRPQHTPLRSAASLPGYDLLQCVSQAVASMASRGGLGVQEGPTSPASSTSPKLSWLSPLGSPLGVNPVFQQAREDGPSVRDAVLQARSRSPAGGPTSAVAAVAAVEAPSWSNSPTASVVPQVGLEEDSTKLHLNPVYRESNCSERSSGAAHASSTGLLLEPLGASSCPSLPAHQPSRFAPRIPASLAASSEAGALASAPTRARSGVMTARRASECSSMVQESDVCLTLAVGMAGSAGGIAEQEAEHVSSFPSVSRGPGPVAESVADWVLCASGTSDGQECSSLAAPTVPAVRPEDVPGMGWWQPAGPCHGAVVGCDMGLRGEQGSGQADGGGGSGSGAAAAPHTMRAAVGALVSVLRRRHGWAAGEERRSPACSTVALSDAAAHSSHVAAAGLRHLHRGAGPVAEMTFHADSPVKATISDGEMMLCLHHQHESLTCTFYPVLLPGHCMAHACMQHLCEMSC